jgi:hypothetical protein
VCEGVDFEWTDTHQGTSNEAGREKGLFSRGRQAGASALMGRGEWGGFAPIINLSWPGLSLWGGGCRTAHHASWRVRGEWFFVGSGKQEQHNRKLLCYLYRMGMTGRMFMCLWTHLESRPRAATHSPADDWLVNMSFVINSRSACGAQTVRFFHAFPRMVWRAPPFEIRLSRLREGVLGVRMR